MDIIGYLGTISSGVWNALIGVAIALIALRVYFHSKSSDKKKESKTDAPPTASKIRIPKSEIAPSAPLPLSPQLPISPSASSLQSSPLHSDLSRIPTPTVKLVGRQSYLDQLNESYNDPTVSIVSFIAPGGVGKSAITDEWLTRIAKEKYSDAKIVFGWSFYSQGSHETSTNSTQFYEKALPFFGYEGELPKSDEEKAKKLAELMQSRKCLLILDGVEPLQHKPKIQHGWFSDMGLKILLDHIGRNGLTNNGLILISSRQKLIEMEKYKERNYREINLEFLSDKEGAELLESLGVEKFQDELSETSKEYGGHALALVLLGKMLKNQFNGDIKKRDRIPDLFEDEDQGGHALRVMKFYSDTWDKNAPEQIFLRMLGLFDRPMGEGEKAALLEKASFAKPLKNLSESEGEWNKMLYHLKNIGLLLETAEGINKKTYDTHPLVRNYFGKLFKKEDEKIWKEAHKVLFEYFQTVPEKKQPDTLQDLEPLYRAVIHGCLAGEYLNALSDVYLDRIRRGNEAYSIKKLGAFASDLTAISGFFPGGWEKPVSSGLSEEEQAWLLAEASFCLMSLGRMEEAVGPRRINIETSGKLKDWKEASVSAGNLVDLLIPTGNLVGAKEAAEKGIIFADKSKDLFRQMANRSKLAYVEHAIGSLDKTLKIFKEAEKFQEERQLKNSQLYSLSGAQYCVLLLDMAKKKKNLEDVLDRGKYGLEISARNNQLISIALDRLTIGRALERLNRTGEAQAELGKAVKGIRGAGTIYHLPLVYLARAVFHRRQSEWEEARRDLDEAMEVAIRCGLKLYKADGLLLEANLNLDTLSKDGTKEKAREALNIADKSIRDMKYGLRFAEVDLLSARVCYYEDKRTEAKEHFDKAVERIESTGHYGLMREVERVKAEINH